MKYPRPVSLAAVFAFAVFAAPPAPPQSSPVADTSQSHALDYAQRLPTGVAQQAIPPGQKTQIHFAPATAYDSTRPYAESVAVADLNGDGKLDLVVANACQSTEDGLCVGYGDVAVLLGNGDGTFQPAVTFSTGAYLAYSVAVGDLNGDGIPDLVVANLCQVVGNDFTCIDASPGELSVFLGNGDGTFQPAVTYSSGGLYANSVVIGDVNGDGTPDLVVANGGASGNNNGSVGVLLGNGDGTFRSAVTYDSGGYDTDSVTLGDVNGDGVLDAVVANWCQYSGDCGAGGGVGVLLGNGDGTFQAVATYSSDGGPSYSVAVADLRGHGIMDLVVANFAVNGTAKPNAVGVLLGNGDGTFQPAVSYLAGGAAIDSVAVGDVNGDGIPDVVVADDCQSTHGPDCIGTGKVSVLLGNGDGTFQAPVVYGSGGYEGSAIAIGDVNGDGRPDIVVTNACGSSCGSPEGSVGALLNKTSYSTKAVLTASPNPSQVNQQVTFTATMTSTPSIPNGEAVTFYNGKTNLGTAKITNGVASLTTSFSKAKTYTIKADYPGDAFHKKSSGTVKQVVNP